MGEAREKYKGQLLYLLAQLSYDVSVIRHDEVYKTILTMTKLVQHFHYNISTCNKIASQKTMLADDLVAYRLMNIKAKTKHNCTYPSLTGLLPNLGIGTQHKPWTMPRRGQA